MVSTTTYKFGAKEQTAKHLTTSSHLLQSKQSRCSLRCQQEPGDLADRNMSGNVVYRPAHDHFPQQKIGNGKTVSI